MRIFFLSELTKSPWGGGNQFQVALQKEFAELGRLSNRLDDATVALLNSHHRTQDIRSLKRWKNGGGILIHRVDGPIVSTRGLRKGIATDSKVVMDNWLLADGTVFQSQWSLATNLRFYKKFRAPRVVIPNAAGRDFFPRMSVGHQEKISVVASSWSTNWRKGFDFLSYIDKHLDFSSFSFTFVGRAPVPFRNIRTIEPLDSKDLAEEIRKHDVYFAPSCHDPCSNALLEGIQSGLFPVARASGGHPEILSGQGLLFSSKQEALDQLNRARYLILSGAVLETNVSSIGDIASAYLSFFMSVAESAPRLKNLELRGSGKDRSSGERN